MSEITCPYCEAENEEPVDCYDPNEIYTYECGNCEKTFCYTIDFTINYYEHEAPCQNGEEHNWRDNLIGNIHLIEYYDLSRDCLDCGKKERKPKKRKEL